MADKKYKIDIDITRFKSIYNQINRTLNSTYSLEAKLLKKSIELHDRKNSKYRTELNLLDQISKKYENVYGKRSNGSKYNDKSYTDGRKSSDKDQEKNENKKEKTNSSFKSGYKSSQFGPRTPLDDLKYNLKENKAKYGDFVASGRGKSSEAKDTLKEIKKQTKLLDKINRATGNGGRGRGGAFSIYGFSGNRNRNIRRGVTLAGGLVAGGMAYALNRGLEHVRAEDQLDAMIGVKGSTSALDTDRLSKMGMTAADANQYGRALFRSRGYATMQNDVGSRLFTPQSIAGGGSDTIEDYLSFEKARGLDRGSLIGLARYQRLDTNKLETLGDARQLFNTMTSVGAMTKDDQTRSQELLEQLVQINEYQASYMEKISSKDTSELMGVFEKIGGSFGGKRMSGTMTTVLDSLRNPSNDYMRAMNYNILRKRFPNARFDELRELEAGGDVGGKFKYSQKQFFEDTIKMIQSAGMNEGQSKIMMEKRFGLNPSQAGTLVRRIGQTSTDELFNVIAKRPSQASEEGKERANAERYTNSLDQIKATLDNLAMTFGSKAIDVISAGLNGKNIIMDALNVTVNSDEHTKGRTERQTPIGEKVDPAKQKKK